MQEFFKRIRELQFPDTQMDIAKACLIYLSLEAFACNPNHLEYSARTLLLDKQHIFHYAVMNWGYHVEKWDNSISDIALPFLEDGLKLRSPVIPCWASLIEALNSLLERGVDVNSRTKMLWRTPLLIAVQRDQKSIVEKLLEQQDTAKDI